MTARVDPDKNLFFTPADYFDGLLADIDSARQEIILEIYLFELDAIGNRFLRALSAAIGRGVRLRVLLDGVGSFRHATRIADELQGENCEVRIFHPLPWDFRAYRRAIRSGRWYSHVLQSLASINRRNHRKLCVIDQRIAWLGSFNLSAMHTAYQPPGSADYWHDTGLRIAGPMVASLRQNFEQVWHRKGGRLGERSRRFIAPEEITRRRQSGLHLIKVLRNSERRIWITNAYFNPSRQLLKILKQKARAGVSVQLIVPARSDVFFVPALTRSFYADLLNAGIRVFEYRRRVLHSKTMVIDDSVLIGSTNLNYRSLLHDYELDAMLSDPELVSRVSARFVADIADSDEITLRRWREHPLLLKLFGWTARLLRYWS